MTDELVARIFLDATEEHRTLLIDVLHKSQGLLATEVDIRRNPDSDAKALDGDDWLLYPVTVEVFQARKDCQRAEIVRDLSLLLSVFDLLGLQYVTACEFEESLPNHGRSRHIH